LKHRLDEDDAGGRGEFSAAIRGGLIEAATACRAMARARPGFPPRFAAASLKPNTPRQMGGKRWQLLFSRGAYRPAPLPSYLRP